MFLPLIFLQLPASPPIRISQYCLLASMAFVGGVMNAVAGGGSFFSFPALLGLHLPPVNANATNSLALWPGQLASLMALRRELRAVRSLVTPVILTSVAGGSAGAVTLLHTSQATFMRLVPWLMFFGTILFAVSSLARNWLEQSSSRRLVSSGNRGSFTPWPLFWLTLVSFYIGYFGAGSAVMIFAIFSVYGIVGDLHQVNALKVLCNVVANGISVFAFIVARAIYWRQGLFMLAMAVAGGYLGGTFTRKLPAKLMRMIVIAAGLSFSIYYFQKG
jgi:hypothetical protein